MRVVNFKSIVDSGEVRIERLQMLVGENNTGKSNLLKAIEVFLTAGKGGVDESCYFDKTKPIMISLTFSELLESERMALRRYLMGDKLVLEKHISIKDESGSRTIGAEYHGYEATPRDWWLSATRVVDHEGARPNWRQIASDHGMLEFVQESDGRVNKASYEKGLEKLLGERGDIQYEVPTLGNTQALGYQPVLLKKLPEFYLLPAITDYSNEIDRRSSSTVFRRLMGDLADRIIKADPRYAEVESTIQKLSSLLNPEKEGEEIAEGQGRLQTLGAVESVLRDKIAKLMPSVESVRLEVIIDEVKEFFSRGVTLKVNDGVLTDVLDKGHGLQRCVVFGLLQALIANRKGELLGTPVEPHETRPMILSIEEPELYIHPQMQRLLFGVLQDFSRTDQVMYSTHSPAFVNIADYHCVGVVRKESTAIGTKVCQCAAGVLDTESEKKTFQFLNSFGLEQNQLFFAKHVVLVEGEEDTIAIMAVGRELKLFREFPEEIGFTVIETGSKGEMHKFQKLLNAFSLPFTVWLEMDGKKESEAENDRIIQVLSGNRCIRIPVSLEREVGHTGHFGTAFEAKNFFAKPENICDGIKKMVKETFQV